MSRGPVRRFPLSPLPSTDGLDAGIITNANSGSKFTFAKDDTDAEDIWYSRKVALWSALDYIPGSRCFVTDVCVPISNLPQLIAETKVDIESEGICGPYVLIYLLPRKPF